MKDWKNKLNTILKDTMKSGNSFKAGVIKMLKTDLTNEEIKNNREELTEEQVMKVIQTAAKRRKESIEEFRKAGKEERAVEEEKELAILAEFLPEQMSAAEIDKIINAAVKEVNPEGMKDFGKIMGIIMPQVKGKADGKLVNELVKKKLEK